MTGSTTGPETDQRLGIFLSYCRDDLAVADQIYATLIIGGYLPLIDREGIVVGEAWEQRLREMLRSADTMLVLLSPSSAVSPACRAEVDWALADGKRIIPAVCRPLGDAKTHPALAALNYIYLYPEPRKSGTSFGAGLLELREALNTDLQWLREHTRLLQKATEWLAAGRSAVRLLSGSDIDSAKDWMARQPREAPLPTELHLDYMRSSEEEERRRESVESQRLRQMAAAQAEREAALVAKEQAQKQEAAARAREALQAKRVVRRTLTGLAASLLLAAAAGGFGYVANTQRLKAERALQQVRSNAAVRVEALAEQVKLQRAAGVATDSSAMPDAARAAAERDDPEVLADRAEAWLEQGQFAEARSIAERGLAAARRSARGQPAVEQRRRLTEIRHLRILGIAAARQGSASRTLAVRSLQTALDRANALVAEYPAAPAAREALATALQDAGDIALEAAHAEGEVDPGTTTPNQDTAAFSEARERFEQLLQLRRSAHAASSGSAETRLALAAAHNRMANLETVRGRANAAETQARSAIALLIEAPSGARPEDLRELCVSYYFMADAQARRTQYDQAMVWGEKAVRIATQQANASPSDATLQHRLSVALSKQSQWMEEARQPRQAMVLLEQATDAGLRAIELAGRHRPEWMRDAAALLSERARLLFAQKRSDAAIDALWQSLALRERVAALSSIPQWQTELEEAYTATRLVLNEQRRPGVALEVAEQQLFATALAPCLFGVEAECRTAQVTRVANALTQLGWTALLASNPQRALWATQRALTLDPGTPGARLNHAHALMLTGSRAEALQVYGDGPRPPGGDAHLLAWRAEVLADFRSLQAQGVRVPLMAELESRFKP